MTAVPQFRPDVRHTVRASVVLVIIAVVILGLSFAVIGPQVLLAVAILLCIATLVFPRAPAAWFLAALLAFVSLGPVGTPPSWKFFVVLAGAHLLHLVGMTRPWLPTGGRIELRVFGRMLRTFLIIQIPAQVVSYFVLTLLAGQSALASPVFGIVAALGFVAAVALIVVPLARERGSE